jgi:hypothetical protein
VLVFTLLGGDLVREAVNVIASIKLSTPQCSGGSRRHEGVRVSSTVAAASSGCRHVCLLAAVKPRSTSV